MHDIVCSDNNFDPEFTNEYILSIQVGLDGFSFSIIDDLKKTFLVFKHFTFILSNNLFLFRKIKEIITKEEILQKKYKKVHVSFINQKFSFIPETFENLDEEAIYNLNFEKTEEESLSSFKTSFFSSKIVFAHSSMIMDLFNSYFENCIFSHQLESLLDIASEKIKQQQFQSIILVNNNFFYLLITKGNNLIFANSFSYKNDLDFIYFLLNSYKSLNINTHDSDIHVSGKIKVDSHLSKFIKKYFCKVEFMKLSKDFQYDNTFNKFPPHMFINLINIKS